jgi:hypothetical protein
MNHPQKEFVSEVHWLINSEFLGQKRVGLRKQNGIFDTFRIEGSVRHGRLDLPGLFCFCPECSMNTTPSLPPYTAALGHISHVSGTLPERDY